MPFRPINEDHAIQSASFAVALSRPLSWSSIEGLIKSPLEWRRDLPALDLSQTLEVQINQQTGAPVNRITRGVEFSHKRPDGSASWQLAILGSEIKVETTIYTRWKPTWAKAGDILLGVVGQLAALESAKAAISIQAISLLVGDVFLPEGDEPDYTELFVQSEHIPAGIFRKGKLWHSHTGWFVHRTVGNVLNQLNIDVRNGIDEAIIVGVPDNRIRVIIQHNQVLRPHTPISFLADDQGEFERILLTEMPVMHENNKAITRDLLTEPMQDRIKVNR
jgi:uncharacterized protein (TIGR04255 family)